MKLIACDGEKGGEVTQITSRHQNAIDTCNGWEQISAFAGNNNCHFRFREAFAQSRDRGSCQDQIADSLKLQEKNFHPPYQGAVAAATGGDLEIATPWVK